VTIKNELKKWGAVMTEMLFILTVIFVAYVVYVVVNDHKATSKSTIPTAKPEPQKELAEPPMPEVVVKNVKPTIIKPVAINKTISPSTTQNTIKKGLRNPETGEVTTTYNNYRFTKRWIKDALVTEGLVEKVYKNNELDNAIEAKIKDALVKLEAFEKYKP
jgi:hypothetical protein